MRELPGVGKIYRACRGQLSRLIKRSDRRSEHGTSLGPTLRFTRAGRFKCRTVKALWQRAASLVPKSSARTYNSALTDLGALIWSAAAAPSAVFVR